MKFLLAKLAVLAILFLNFNECFSQRKILILGSSTSACIGPSVRDSCYVDRLLRYYNTPPNLPITVDNRAVSGFNFYKSMPIGYTPPPGRDYPEPYYSITQGLTANPDVVLINYPSNGYDIFSIAEIMDGFRRIKKAANDAGKPCYITTTQPRSEFAPDIRTKLRVIKDSIVRAFGEFAIDFYTGLAEPATDLIAVPYRSPYDGIHLNDAGHRILFQRVIEKNIFSSITAKAGNDVVLTLPTSLTYLDGSLSSSPGATIISAHWSKISGPDQYFILTPDFLGTYIKDLVKGIYIFRLTVTDSKGATAIDDVMITVNPEEVVQSQSSPPPIPRAGNDVVLKLPDNLSYLDGSASTAAAGSIVKYKWSKISGPANFSIATPDFIGTYITGLVQGVYNFRLTVTDNKGGTASDDVMITVNADEVVPVNPTGPPPVARAGNDITLKLPNNLTYLDGSASTATSGSISKYKWSKVSGPGTFTISTPDFIGTYITGLVEGTYVFRLQVTDSKGGVGQDDISVIVSSGIIIPQNPSGPAPIARAGSDVIIKLPTNLAYLDGSASSAPAGVGSYNWSKVSGPASFFIATPQFVGTYITGLVQGEYVFRLTLTDKSGQISSDDIKVTVNASSGNSLKNDLYPGSVEEKLTLQIFPNPVTNYASIKWRSSYKGTATIQLFDGSSRLIRNIKIIKNRVDFLIGLDANTLKPGFYLISVKSQNGSSLIKYFFKN